MREGVCCLGVMLDSAFPSPLAHVCPCSFAVHQVQPLMVWIAEVVCALGGGAGADGGSGGGGGGGGGAGGGGAGGFDGCCTGGLDGCCVGAFWVEELLGLDCPGFALPGFETELAFAAGAPPHPVRAKRTPATVIKVKSFRDCERAINCRQAEALNFIQGNSDFAGDRTERGCVRRYYLLVIIGRVCCSFEQSSR